MIERYLLALVIMARVYPDPATFAFAAYDKIDRWAQARELADHDKDRLYEVVARYIWEQL